MTFQDEYRRLLERYRIAFDESMYGIEIPICTDYRAPLGRRIFFCLLPSPLGWAKG